jgi:RNA polymerase sigma factor (TIGR02999 family)
MSEVTQLLARIGSGDLHATQQLLPLVYDELRRLASARLAQEKPGHSLQATALVHEAYLRLVNPDDNRPWNSQSHFLAAAAEAMRRILVDRARSKRRAKRGGGAQRVELDIDCLSGGAPDEEVLAVHEALDELQQHDAQVAALVKLRYFVGLSHTEAAEALGVTRRAADRLWAAGRAWLYRRLSEK